MPTVSFKRPGAPASAEATAAPATPPAAQPPPAAAQPPPPAATPPPPAAKAEPVRSLAVVGTAGLSGEFNARDVSMPYLTLCQKSGTLFDEHPEFLGHFVYDRNFDLTDEIKMVVFSMNKYYIEKTEFNSGEIPQRFDTIAEARGAGVEFTDVCDVDVLVETADADGGVNFGGSSWIPTRWTVRSSAYGRVVGTILKDLSGWLKGDLSGGIYMVAADKKITKGNSYFVPVVKAAGKIDAAFRAAIKERTGQ